MYDYKALPLEGAVERVDEEAGATYSFDAARRHMVTYDNVAMARRKAAWVRDQGLGGAMWWESSADKSGGDSLIANVAEALGELEARSNCLVYPQSKFENLRKGFC